MTAPLGTILIYARDMSRTAEFYRKYFGFQTSGQVVEGLTTAPVLRDVSRRIGVELPITEGVCAILEGQPLHELAASLMGRRPTEE